MENAPALNPCWHMRNLVHRMAEGTLAGALLKYAKFHIGACKRCKQTLQVLRATLNRLRRLQEPQPELPTERWASIEAAWLDHEQTSPPE